MNITEARWVAELVNNHRWKGFESQVRAAFWRLHKNADKGIREDRQLAQVLWDYVGAGYDYPDSATG